jgi:hypothetical protein
VSRRRFHPPLAFSALFALAFVACSRHDESSAQGSDQKEAGTPSTGPDAAAGLDGGGGSVDGGASSDGSGSPAPGDGAGQGEASTPVRGWDWNGVVGTGQSLAVGAMASNAALTAQPFKNLKLSLGTAKVGVPPYNANDPALSVVPLVEPIRAEAPSYPGAYPLNIYGETPHTAMADQISALYQKDTGGDYITVHTVVGESGQGISVIDKTATVTSNMGHAYAATLFEASALKRLATAAGKTYGVTAIILTHGESDAGNSNYESDVFQLYTDYNADISAITGQAAKIPLLLTQQQTSPGDNSTTASLIAQWKIGVDHPGEVICAGPKYQYAYASDHIHLIASGYDRLGEKYGEVYYEKVALGHDWQPLQPVSVSRNGNVITVSFHVPVPPLAWDDAMPLPHQTAHAAWMKGRGFEVQNQSGEQTINSVAIAGDSVVITLASVPVATNLVVRYAVTQDGTGSLGGLATGRIGQLRDSDPLVGYATKLPQQNYAVSFVLPVN